MLQLSIPAFAGRTFNTRVAYFPLPAPHCPLPVSLTANGIEFNVISERLTVGNQDAVWIIDDDGDDHELVTDIFSKANIKNPLQFFNGAKAMLKALEETDVAPFIIISDVNLPGMDGFELRKALLETPNNKFHSVPFIFWSTAASEQQVKTAFELKAHGFFIKQLKFDDWKVSLVRIIEYWKDSRTPTKEDKPEKPER